MDLVGQFENSWQSVRPLLARLARAHAAKEARLESADGGDAGARFTCFASTTVQILTPADALLESTCDAVGARFTCFTSTKVQI